MRGERIFGRQNNEYLAQKVFRISSGVDRDFNSWWAAGGNEFGCAGSGRAKQEPSASSAPSPSSCAPASLPVNRFGDLRAGAGLRPARCASTSISIIGDDAGADDAVDDDDASRVAVQPEPAQPNSLPPAAHQELKSRSMPEEVRKTFCAKCS